MQDQRYSDSKVDELKYVTLKGVKTSSKKSPQQMATRIAEKIAIAICIKIARNALWPQKREKEQNKKETLNNVVSFNHILSIFDIITTLDSQNES